MLCFEGLVFFCKVGWCSSFFCNFLLKVLPPWFLLASFMVFELEIVYKGMVSTFSLVDKHFNRIALNVSLWASLLKWSSSVFERASVPVTVHIGGIRPLWQNLLTTSGWFKHARHLILFLALTPCFIGTVSMFWSFSRIWGTSPLLLSSEHLFFSFECPAASETSTGFSCINELGINVKSSRLASLSISWELLASLLLTDDDAVALSSLTPREGSVSFFFRKKKSIFDLAFAITISWWSQSKRGLLIMAGNRDRPVDVSSRANVYSNKVNRETPYIEWKKLVSLPKCPHCKKYWKNGARRKLLNEGAYYSRPIDRGSWAIYMWCAVMPS